MLADDYGNPLTTASSAARDAYVAGYRLLLMTWPGADTEFARATEAVHHRVLWVVAHAHRAHDVLVVGVFALGRVAQVRAAHEFGDPGIFLLRRGHGLMEIVVEREVNLRFRKAEGILLGAQDDPVFRIGQNLGTFLTLH